jgi:hypothetical protein
VKAGFCWQSSVVSNPALSILPQGWMERLIPFRTPRTGGVTAWCLEPHDLFVSKLVAWRDKDQIFLKGMLRHKFGKPAIVRQRINDLPIADVQKKDLRVAFDELIANCRAEQRKKRTRK